MPVHIDSPKAASDRRVEPVEKPLKRQILPLSGQRRISLILIRIVMAMILSPDDELFLTWPSSRATSQAVNRVKRSLVRRGFERDFFYRLVNQTVLLGGRMGAIPTSDMPGHAKLHERVLNALDRCQESKGVDFKESAPWDNLKWQLIRTAIAMGNLRDGGIIVIGASERGDSWDLTGIANVMSRN